MAIVPSIFTHKVYTVVLALGFNVVSSTPVEEYLAIRFLVVAHPTVVKVPPKIIFPLLSIRIV